MKSIKTKGVWALAILAGCTMMAGAVQAASMADIAGTWSGGLTGPSGKQVPIIIHVMAEGVGTADSPAQGVFGVPATDFTLEHNLLTFNVPGISAHFHGMLDGDIMTIDGQWERGDMALPLRLVRRDTALQP